MDIEFLEGAKTPYSRYVKTAKVIEDRIYEQIRYKSFRNNLIGIAFNKILEEFSKYKPKSSRSEAIGHNYFKILYRLMSRKCTFEDMIDDEWDKFFKYITPETLRDTDIKYFGKVFI